MGSIMSYDIFVQGLTMHTPARKLPLDCPAITCVTHAERGKKKIKHVEVLTRHSTNERDKIAVTPSSGLSWTQHVRVFRQKTGGTLMLLLVFVLRGYYSPFRREIGAGAPLDKTLDVVWPTSCKVFRNMATDLTHHTKRSLRIRSHPHIIDCDMKLVAL